MTQDCDIKVYRKGGAKLPFYAKEDDACMDVIAYDIEYDTTNPSHNRVIVHTGLFFELPPDYEMVIRPRSSLTKHRWTILNAPGTLDAGYRGELMIIFTPLDRDIDIEKYFPYGVGDRIAQIAVQRKTNIHWLEVDSLDDLSSTSRGTGGFGSTD